VDKGLGKQFKSQKGEALCQEKIQQGQPVKNPKQVALAARVEAEWVGRLPQDRAETVYVSVVVAQCLTRLDSHVIKEVVLNVVRP
jgi:hypothetical protein